MTEFHAANSGVVIVTHSRSGHRQRWSELCASLVGARIVVSEQGVPFADLIRANHVFFLNIDDHFALAFYIAALRRLYGRRTAGLVLAAQKVAAPSSLKHRLKRLFYTGARLLTGMKLYLCVSGLIPEYSGLWDGCLEDLNTFDLTLLPLGSSPCLPAEIKAPERPLIASLGVQGPYKRPDLLMRAYVESPALRDAASVGIFGQLRISSPELAAEFVANGGILVDRYLEDGELAGTMQAAAILWGLYAADTYDQTSGVFGHALQLGKPCLVRSGSRLAAMQARLGYQLTANEDVSAVVPVLLDAIDSPLLLDKALGQEIASGICQRGMLHWRSALIGNTVVQD